MQDKVLLINILKHFARTFKLIVPKDAFYVEQAGLNLKACISYNIMSTLYSSLHKNHTYFKTQ